jgi:hypothetical protein
MSNFHLTYHALFENLKCWVGNKRAVWTRKGDEVASSPVSCAGELGSGLRELPFCQSRLETWRDLNRG